MGRPPLDLPGRLSFCFFMVEQLKKTYAALLAPAILAMPPAWMIKENGYIPYHSIPSETVIAPAVFILSVVCAIAMPVFLRALFAHRVRHHQTVPQSILFRFERRTMATALIAPYLILPAYLMDFPDFYLSGGVLSALYAVYYFYPSEKRIRFEKRVFRVN